MAGHCVERLPHPECGSVDSLQVFEEDGKFTGFCYACRTYIPNPYNDKPEGYKPTYHVKTEEEIKAEIDEINSYPTTSLPDRKLRKETLDHFNVKVGLSEEDGTTPAFHYYPATKKGHLRGYKVRMVEGKRLWTLGDMKDVDLFGWEQAKLSPTKKKIFITEGEIDAMSLFQMLVDRNKGSKYEHLVPAVVSIVHGASSAVKDIMPQMSEIQGMFEEIIYIADQDKAGLAAEEALAKAFPNIRFVTLPCKDINDGLVNGHKNAVVNACLFNSSMKKNTRLITAASLHDEAKKAPPAMGLSWPFNGLTKALRGKRFGEVRYFGAGTKMGKSELVNALAAHDIKEHDLKVLLVKPEEEIKKTYRLLAGKLVGSIFHDPNITIDEEAFDRAGEMMQDHVLITDLYQRVDWAILKEDIRYAVLDQGVKEVYLDPITCFTNSMSTSEANEFLTNMTAEIAEMAKDLDFGCNIFCHLKAPTGGNTPHEFGGKVMSAQFAGSRAMQRSCHLMIGMQGNKDPELEEDVRNQRELVILEDREFGSSASIKLFWNKNTGLFTEMP